MRFVVASSYGYWGAFKPSDLRNPEAQFQIGGGETAMISIARELAAIGHEVFVFYDTARPGKYENVDYLPNRMFVDFVTNVEHDVMVTWDATHHLRYADKARCHIVAWQLNDAFVGPYDWATDLYFHPSEWHAKRFKSLYPEISERKQVHTITNGVDPYRYARQVERDPYRVIYSSSPDRGLHHLLRLWPQVQKAVPQANLHVFYDMDKWLKTVDDCEAAGLIVNTYERAQLLKEYRRQYATNESITFHGGIGQWALAAEQMKSAVMAYPCDPVQPTEGFSMSCLEGLTAGCRLITSNADALGELWTSAPGATVLPLPMDDNVWVETLVNQLLEPAQTPGTQSIRYPEHHTWRALAVRWVKEVSQWRQSH